MKRQTGLHYCYVMLTLSEEGGEREREETGDSTEQSASPVKREGKGSERESKVKLS